MTGCIHPGLFGGFLMNKKTIVKTFLLTLSLFVLAACGSNSGNSGDSSGSGSDDEKITVMTSFYPMYEFTKEVAGDRANVDVMLSSGEDAHSYEPSAQDVAKVTEADAFVYSSDEMEYWVESLLQTVENEDLILARASDGLSEEATPSSSSEEDHAGHSHEAGSHEGHSQEEHSHGDHSHEGGDPHNWLDPLAVVEQVDVIRDSLIEADPEGETTYTQNAEDFKAELQQLHEDYEAELSGAENRTFFTQHQAFGHLANRYDLEQVSIGGLSTEVESSPSRIAEITQEVVDQQVPVIYYQSGGDSSLAETVAEEAEIEAAPLYDLESQTEEMEEQGLNYIGAMRQNLENLKMSIQ